MRQVPFQWQRILRSIFLITFLDEIILTSSFPVLTFLCFDRRSNLFPFFSAHESGAFWYGILNALAHVVSMLTVPVLAWLSDGVGRKRILMIAVVSNVLYSLCVASGILQGSFVLVLIGFLVCGVCVRVEPIALAVVSEQSNSVNKKQRMGLLQFWISAGAFVGPIVGGFFAERYFFNRLNFALPFMIGLVVSVVLVVLVAVFFRDTRRVPNPDRYTLIETARRLFDRRVLALFVVLLLTQFSWSLYYQFIPPVLKVNYHYSATLVGIFVASIAMWLALASTVGIGLLGRFFNTKRCLIFGCGLLAFGLVLSAIACLFRATTFTQMLIWAAACPIAAGDVIAYIMITTLLSDAVSQSDQGKIMGFVFMVIPLVWGGTGVLGGVLSTIHVTLPIVAAPVCLLAALLLCVFSLLCLAARRHRMKEIPWPISQSDM